MAFTIREIENAKPAGKPCKMTDGGGLCLLIAPSGAKLWRWRYYFEGKEKMMAFGEYPVVSLKDVRDLHFAARKTLTAGIDPIAERKAEAEAKQKETKTGSGKRKTALRRLAVNGASRCSREDKTTHHKDDQRPGHPSSGTLLSLPFLSHFVNEFISRYP
jgi:hypothetical protein